MSSAAVVNHGVPGYTSFQGRRLLAEILSRHRPDFVILAFGANDLELDVASDTAKAERIGPVRLRLYSALTHLATARLFLRRSDARTDPDRTPQSPRVSPAEFRENLHAMIRAARGAGARVILLDLVLIGPVFREAIAEIAQQEEVPGSTPARSCGPVSTISSPEGASRRSAPRSIASGIRKWSSTAWSTTTRHSTESWLVIRSGAACSGT